MKGTGAMDAVTLGPFVLPTAVLLVAGAILAAKLLADWFRRRRGLDPGPILWKMIVAGFVAARAVFVLRHHELFAERPWAAFDFRDGGLDSSAGLLVACVVGAELTRRHALLRRPLLASSLAGIGLWLGGTLALQAFAPPQAPLPELSVRRLDGAEVALRSFQGKPMVVNLWASWCPPCRREMPALGKAQREASDLNFVFVNQGEDSATVRAYLKAEGLPLRNVVRDPGGALAKAAGAPGLPTTLFFDANGILVDKRMGEVSSATLAEHLAALRSKR